MIIEDGKGLYGAAGVSPDQRLLAECNVSPRVFYRSQDHELAFSWTSSYAVQATEAGLYVKNTSVLYNLYIDVVRVSGPTASLWTLRKVTGTGSGTTVTGTNLNFSSTIAAEATALGNAAVTGLTAGVIVTQVYSGVGIQAELDFDGALILGQNDAVALVATTTQASACALVVRGWYE